MIIFVLMEFRSKRRNGLGNWIKKLSKYTTEKYMYIVEEGDKNECPDNIAHEFFPENKKKRLMQKYQNEDEFVYAATVEGVKEIEDFYERILCSICKQNDFVMVYSLFKNQSLQSICEKNKIPFKNIEVTALRQDLYYDYDLCWFLKDYQTYSGEEGETRYESFLKEKEERTLKSILSSKELLLLGLKKEDILPTMSYIDNFCEDIDIGIALPPYDHKEERPRYTRGELFEEVLKKYGEKSIALKTHPADVNNYDYEGLRDYSSSSLRFISQCRNVISAGSNISFEAMLCGKNVIDVENMPYLSAIIGEVDIAKQCAYTDEYLNFLFFSMFVPMELLGDETYLKWRIKGNPREVDIYNYHVQYICRKWLDCSVEELDGAVDKPVFILTHRIFLNAGIRGRVLDTISDFLNYDWTRKEVYICGTGKDAMAVKSILNNMDVNIKGFVVMDGHKEKYIDGLPVKNWEDIDNSSEGIFVITQNNPVVQMQVYEKLRQSDVKDIVIL